MPRSAPTHPATIPGVEHGSTEVRGRALHHVSAGGSGSPVLLVHGFPETWWVFHRLIPWLAPSHRVVAVDLPGFGDSGRGPGDLTSAAVAEDLHALVAALGLGPVHLLGQDIAGGTVFRLAATHPDDVRSLVAVETTLPGFGFEALADVGHGGVWHIGVLASRGAADFVFGGRERRYLEEVWFPRMTAVPGAVTPEDLDELVRAYSAPDAWHGTYGLYSSALTEGEQIQALVTGGTFRAPVLAVDAMGAPRTATTMQAVSDRVTTAVLDGVGHHVALEAPERLADLVLPFLAEVDRPSADAQRSSARRATGTGPDGRIRAGLRPSPPTCTAPAPPLSWPSPPPPRPSPHPSSRPAPARAPAGWSPRRAG
ncbi:alpha/beta fold hydrolase [Microlunatus flavus]|uniref:Pimeloyl-ACP methyl ester carboxylesterase n=1 Tax=Microlunatus flavus TaxID=1036181 RepID=A0A1H9M3C8_9ACTN|nr:alpha/beta hydrolase [Microlunatus flavus]SER18039.1 Pimeloyl-ACP methyl ester carboxylesterase [Microlunatus flavus]